MREYVVKTLNNTSLNEKNFDMKYHLKYLNKTGEVIEHPFKTDNFKEFICLGFDKNEQGQFTDIDWFHRSDLGLPSLWGFTKEDLERNEYNK